MSDDVVYVNVPMFQNLRLTLNTEQIGAFHFLMMRFAIHGPIPDDDGIISGCLGITRTIWRRRFASALRQYFISDGENLSLLHAERFFRRKGHVYGVGAASWQEMRKEVFVRDKYTCAYCGVVDQNPECDHVIPFSRGGRTTPENLVTSCKPCNRSKGRRTPQEWRQ